MPSVTYVFLVYTFTADAYSPSLIEANQPAVLTSQPATRISTPSSRSVPQLPGVTLPGSSNSHSCVTSKRTRSPLLDSERSKPVRLHNASNTGGFSQRHTPRGDIISIPVPRLQGQISPFGPLLSLPEPDSWLWPYDWESFLDTPFQDGNDEGLKILVTPIRSELIDANDGSTLPVHCKQFGEIALFMSLFPYASRCSDHLDVRHFIPGMLIYGILFMT